MEKIVKKTVITLGLSLVFLSAPSAARAATLYLSPSSGERFVGDTFSISVYVSSADQSMNAASGVISFPAEKLEAVSLSKSGSVFSLWVKEPELSNSAGTIRFEGLVFNPGFIGNGGKIMAINFRAKTEGAADLKLQNGLTLANDGLGTNILSGMGAARLLLEKRPAPVPAPVAPAKKIEPAKTPPASPVEAPPISIPEAPALTVPPPEETLRPVAPKKPTTWLTMALYPEKTVITFEWPNVSILRAVVKGAISVTKKWVLEVIGVYKFLKQTISV